MSSHKTIDVRTPEGRAEARRVFGAGARNKYGARKAERDGYTLDSQAEAAYYDLLKADPAVAWINVHPMYSLGHGIRYCADFEVWRFEEGAARSGRVLSCVVEVKGRATISSDFRTKWKLFNGTHPAAPLVVVVRDEKGWRRLDAP